MPDVSNHFFDVSRIVMLPTLCFANTKKAFIHYAYITLCHTGLQKNCGLSKSFVTQVPPIYIPKTFVERLEL